LTVLGRCGRMSVGDRENSIDGYEAVSNKPTGPPPAPGSPGRPQGAKGQSTAIKIAQIARWRIAGVTLQRCADMLGMTAVGVKVITESQDYIEYEAALMNGHLSAMDEALAGRVNEIRREMKVAVPAALRCLVDAVTQRKDLKTALAAAGEILDRDPDRTLVKAKAEESVAPGIPEEVLDAAIADNNKTAETFAQSGSKKVN
jgi:hypothetical protein